MEMNRSLSFVVGAVAAFLIATGWNVLQSAPVAPAAADQTLGMALMSATVDADATLIRGSGAVGSITTGNPGDFVVTFNRDVRDCTYVASVGGSISPVAHTANVAASAPGVSSGPNTVRMTTSNNGTYANYPFHLIVFCYK
jgi:hypothetical protein